MFTCNEDGIESLSQRYAWPLRIEQLLVGAAKAPATTVSLEYLRNAVKKATYSNAYKLMR